MIAQKTKWSTIGADLGYSGEYCFMVARGRRHHPVIESRLADLKAAGTLPDRRKPRTVARLGRYPLALTRPLMPH